jgi:hypothetical protein
MVRADGPFAGVLNAMTFRFLAPIRRVVPPLGGTLDLSPADPDRRVAARADPSGPLAEVAVLTIFR